MKERKNGRSTNKKIKEQEKIKAHMLPSKINESTPGEIDQVNLIDDLTEEEYLEFEGMCGC